MDRVTQVIPALQSVIVGGGAMKSCARVAFESGSSS